MAGIEKQIEKETKEIFETKKDLPEIVSGLADDDDYESEYVDSDNDSQSLPRRKAGVDNGNSSILILMVVNINLLLSHRRGRKGEEAHRAITNCGSFIDSISSI